MSAGEILRGIPGFLIVIFFAALAFALPEADRYEDYLPSLSSSGELQRPRLTGTRLDIDWLTQFIQSEQQGHNYQSFVKQLFELAPDLKNRFVLLHHSESLQSASPSNPRVLSYSGGVVFAFSEHPDHSKRPKIEMLAIDPKFQSVTLAEIEFHSFAGAKGVTITKNPMACFACHGHQPLTRPLWNPYDFWPNAFGGAIGMPVNQLEENWYENLRTRIAPHSPILSELNLPEKIDIGRNGQDPRTEHVSGFTQFVQGAQMSLGWERLKQAVPQGLAPWDLLIAGVIQHCEQTKDPLHFAIKHLRASADQQALRELFAQQKRKLLASEEQFRKFQNSLLPQFFPVHRPDFIVDFRRLSPLTEDLARIRAILEFAGVPTPLDWLSLSLIGNPYLGHTPANLKMDLLMTYWQAWPDRFAKLRKAPIAEEYLKDHAGRPLWWSFDCAELSQQFVRETRSQPLERFVAPWPMELHRPSVISRCAECHTMGADPLAPEFPFYDAARMRKLLREQGLAAKIQDRILRTDSKKMPLTGSPLSEQEIKSLQHYLQAMVHD